MLYSFDNRKPKIGKDTYVSESALVIGDVTIGDNCYVGHGVILRGDYGTIEIGAGSAAEEGVIVHAPLGGICHIGKSVTLGHGAIIHSKSIGDFAVIGMGAIISLIAEVGERSIIGEGSVVMMRQTIAAGVVAAGSPARVIREVSSKDEHIWGKAKQAYVELARKYLAIGMPRIE